jgi:predicted Zn-dependent peptidase
MSLESSSSRAEQMARQLLLHGRLLSPRELIERVDAVTPQAVRDFAAGMLVESRPALTVVGAGKRSQRWAELAERRMAF